MLHQARYSSLAREGLQLGSRGSSRCRVQQVGDCCVQVWTSFAVLTLFPVAAGEKGLSQNIKIGIRQEPAEEGALKVHPGLGFF